MVFCGTGGYKALMFFWILAQRRWWLWGAGRQGLVGLLCTLAWRAPLFYGQAGCSQRQADLLPRRLL